MQIVSADRRPSGRVERWGATHRFDVVRGGRSRPAMGESGRGAVRQITSRPRQPVAAGSVRRTSASPGALQDLVVEEGAPAPATRPRAVRLRRASTDAACRAGGRRPEPRVPARRGVLGAAVRGGGVRRPAAGHEAPPGVGAGPRVRGRLLLRADVVDARRGPVRLGGALGPGGGVLRPPGGRCAGAAQAARLARLGGRGVVGDGGAEERLAVQRDALGAARVRGRGHPPGTCPGVRRGDRGEPAARARRRPARRPRCRATGGGWSRSAAWSRWPPCCCCPPSRRGSPSRTGP